MGNNLDQSPGITDANISRPGDGGVDRGKGNGNGNGNGKKNKAPLLELDLGIEDPIKREESLSDRPKTAADMDLSGERILTVTHPEQHQSTPTDEILIAFLRGKKESAFPKVTGNLKSLQSAATVAGGKKINIGGDLMDQRLGAIQILESELPEVFEYPLSMFGLTALAVISDSKNPPPDLSGEDNEALRIDTLAKQYNSSVSYRVDYFLVRAEKKPAIKRMLLDGRERRAVAEPKDCFLHKNRSGINVIGMDDKIDAALLALSSPDGRSHTSIQVSRIADTKEEQAQNVQKTLQFPEKITRRTQDVLLINLSPRQTPYSPQLLRSIHDLFDKNCLSNNAVTKSTGLNMMMISGGEASSSTELILIAQMMLTAISEEGTFSACAKIARQKTVNAVYEEDGLFYISGEGIMAAENQPERENACTIDENIFERVKDSREQAALGLTVSPLEVPPGKTKIYEVISTKRRSPFQTMRLPEEVFVCRETETETLRTLLNTPPGDRAMLTIIEGQSGVGKTTILTQTADPNKTVIISSKQVDNLGEPEDLCRGLYRIVDAINFHDERISRVLPKEAERSPDKAKSMLKGAIRMLLSKTGEQKISLKTDNKTAKEKSDRLKEITVTILRTLSIYGRATGLRFNIVFDDPAMMQDRAAQFFGSIVQETRGVDESEKNPYGGLHLLVLERDQIQIESLKTPAQKAFHSDLRESPENTLKIPPFELSRFSEEDVFQPNKKLWPRMGQVLIDDPTAVIDDSVFHALSPLAHRGTASVREQKQIIAFPLVDGLRFLREKSLIEKKQIGNNTYVSAKKEAKGQIEETLQQDKFKSAQIFGVQPVRAIQETGGQAEAVFHMIHHMSGMPKEMIKVAARTYGLPDDVRLDTLIQKLEKLGVLEETGDTIQWGHQFYKQGVDSLRKNLADDLGARRSLADMAFTALHLACEDQSIRADQLKGKHISAAVIYAVAEELEELDARIIEKRRGITIQAETTKRKKYALRATQDAIMTGDYGLAARSSVLALREADALETKGLKNLTPKERETVINTHIILLKSGELSGNYERHLHWLEQEQIQPYLTSQQSREIIEYSVRARQMDVSEHLNDPEELPSAFARYLDAIANAGNRQRAILNPHEEGVDRDIEKMKNEYTATLLDFHKTVYANYYRIKVGENPTSPNNLPLKQSCDIGAAKAITELDDPDNGLRIKLLNLQAEFVENIKAQKKPGEIAKTEKKLRSTRELIDKTVALISLINQFQANMRLRIFYTEAQPYAGKRIPLILNAVPHTSGKTTPLLTEMAGYATNALRRERERGEKADKHSLAKIAVARAEAEGYSGSVKFGEIIEHIRTAAALAEDCAQGSKKEFLWRLAILAFIIFDVHPDLNGDDPHFQWLFMFADNTFSYLSEAFPEDITIKYNLTEFNLRKILLFAEQTGEGASVDATILLRRVAEDIKSYLTEEVYSQRERERNVRPRYSRIGIINFVELFAEFRMVLEIIRKRNGGKALIDRALTPVCNNFIDLLPRQILPKELIELRQHIDRLKQVAESPVPDEVRSYLYGEVPEAPNGMGSLTHDKFGRKAGKIRTLESVLYKFERTVSPIKEAIPA